MIKVKYEKVIEVEEPFTKIKERIVKESLKIRNKLEVMQNMFIRDEIQAIDPKTKRRNAKSTDNLSTIISEMIDNYQNMSDEVNKLLFFMDSMEKEMLKEKNDEVLKNMKKIQETGTL